MQCLCHRFKGFKKRTNVLPDGWMCVSHEIPFSFQNITDAMQMVCEILTADPEGGAARIPFPLFQDLYKYLAQIDGEISQETH